MTATKDPAFLVVSHLYTESESKIEELSLHTETSAYYKEGKYLQYPLSKYENSAEISFWKISESGVATKMRFSFRCHRSEKAVFYGEILKLI